MREGRFQALLVLAMLPGGCRPSPFQQAKTLCNGLQDTPTYEPCLTACADRGQPERCNELSATRRPGPTSGSQVNWVAVAETESDPDAGSDVTDRRPVLSPEVIFSRSAPSVVLIRTTDGQGSGFVVGAMGLIVTNLHVVAGEDEIHVRLVDGREFLVARVESYDVAHDLALLRIKKKLIPLPMTEKKRLVLAQPVYALGNPLGLQATISEGLLSAVREDDSERKVLQITAPISPGSSGGPLLDRYGDVIGVATFVLRGGANLGFGAPVADVRRLFRYPKPMSPRSFARATERYRLSVRPGKADTALVQGCGPLDLALLETDISKLVPLASGLCGQSEYAACSNLLEGSARDMAGKLSPDCASARRRLEQSLEEAGGLGEYPGRARVLRRALLEVLGAAKARRKGK